MLKQAIDMVQDLESLLRALFDLAMLVIAIWNYFKAKRWHQTAMYFKASQNRGKISTPVPLKISKYVAKVEGEVNGKKVS